MITLWRKGKDQPEKRKEASENHERATEQSGQNARYEQASAYEEETQDGHDYDARQRIVTGCESGVEEVRIKFPPSENAAHRTGDIIPQGDVSNVAGVEHFCGSLFVSLLCATAYFSIDIKAGLAFAISYAFFWVCISIEMIVAALRGELKSWRGRNLWLFTPLVSGRFTLAIVSLAVCLAIGRGEDAHWLLTSVFLAMVSGAQSGVSDGGIFTKLECRVARLLKRRAAR